MDAVTLIAAVTLLQAPQPSSPASILDDVRTLCAARDNEQRFDVLTAMLRARNITFTVEPFTIDKQVGSEPRTNGRNVAASFGEGADEIVIGAHYDAARLPDGSLSRGAVDDGAAAVMLVRLAETLKGERLAARVTIVWFDMEELGLLGSARYVAAHASSNNIRAMVNVDIAAYGDTLLVGPPPGGENERLLRTFIETCAQEAIDCIRFDRMPSGDDRSFGKARVPTLSVGLLPALEAHQVWLLLHGGPAAGLAPGVTPAVLRTIHTSDDVPEKVDAASIERVRRFALALVRRLGVQ